jgi:hypothetical protein
MSPHKTSPVSVDPHTVATGLTARRRTAVTNKCAIPTQTVCTTHLKRDIFVCVEMDTQVSTCD